MALHFKSESKYKFLVILSALLISAIAAIFSVTGIAALFSGYYLTVAIMMGVLEFGKIVVASFVSRFWDRLSVALKVYFSIAVIILIMITSGGIFGYLSDAYQKTKGNYDVIETQVNLYDKKLQIFNSEKSRYEKQLSDQQKRLDNMYNSEDNTNWNINNRIKDNEASVAAINTKLNAVNDSISVYESKKALTQTETTKGELGPLKYMANIFDTDMDTIVKYFILLLIFVFDPLAILLFVSVNIMNRKDNKKDLENLEEDNILAVENKIISEPDNIEVKFNEDDNKKNDNLDDTNFIKSDELSSTEHIEEPGYSNIDVSGDVANSETNPSDGVGVDEVFSIPEQTVQPEQEFQPIGKESKIVDDEEWVDRKEKDRQQEIKIDDTEFKEINKTVDEKITYSSANYKH